MTNKLENKISVIVTTYNQERTIGRTLDSILVQQCSIPIEIVVGDDCSTDGTLRVVEQYINRTKEKANGKFEIKLLANERNKGIVDNYFGCLMACSGQYIADCAGDDYWCDILKLEKELRILEQYSDVANEIGKSERTVKSITARLTEQGIIRRSKGKGSPWEIIKD